MSNKFELIDSDDCQNPFQQFCVIADVFEKTGGLINENRIRHLIQSRHRHPGFERCIKKVGKEWMINLPQLFNYIANEQ